MTLPILTSLLFALFIASFFIRPRKELNGFGRDALVPLRGMLALVIVAHHCSQIVGKTEEVSILRFFQEAGTPAVALFFFMTGYGLCASLLKKGNDYIRGFLPKRLLSFWPEALLLTIAGLGLKFFVLHKSSDILLNDVVTGNPPLPYSWFIYAITYGYVAFFLAAKIASCRIKPTGYILTALIIAYMLVVANVFHWGAFWYYGIISIPIGYFFKAYESEIEHIISLKKGYIFATFLAMTAGSCLLPSPVDIYVGVITFVALTYLVIRVINYPPIFAKWLGIQCLNIYLIHGLFLVPIHSIIGDYSLILFVLTMIPTLVGAYILSRLRKYVTDKKKSIVTD